MNVRQHIQFKTDAALEELQRVSKVLENLPEDLGTLEVDSLLLLGTGWLCLRDSTHKDLGAKLATIADQSLRFQVLGSIRTATFHDIGSFYKVDLDRPNPKCRKVRALRPSKEVTLEICGDLPDGYVLLEELE